MSISPSREVQERAMSKIMSDPDLRVWLWSVIEQDCRVFSEEFQTNASVYSLVAVQAIGKRLLADAKRESLENTYLAEKEYHQMMDRTADFNKSQSEGENE